MLNFQKHFTFFANAPIDRDNVDVAASKEIFVQALTGLSVYDMGAKAGAGELARAWAEMNFSPLQTTLYAPIPDDVSVDAINYLRVDFFKGQYTNENATPAHSYFFFVDDVKPVDGEETNDDPVYIFALTLDEWATNVLFSNARFFGGEITAATDINAARFPYARADALRASSLTFPFSVEKAQTDGWEQNAINIIPVFKSNSAEGDVPFRVLISFTGKDLRRSVFACCTRVFQTLKDALIAAQYMSTSRKVHEIEPEAFPVNPTIVKTFNEGEWTVQGLWVLPSAITAVNTDNSVYMIEVAEDWNPETGTIETHEKYFFNLIDAPLNKVHKINFRECYARYLGAETTEEINETIADEFGGLRKAWRVDVGTLSNRVDITEQAYKNDTTQNPDAFINAVFGRQTFNIFLHVGARKIDITNDFQTYTLLDPENEFIKNNKTNSILTGIGSVGAIVGGVVSVASGAGAGVGVAAIAGGASSLAQTISKWKEGTSVPDVISGVGFADTTNLYGGVYLTATREFPAWYDAINKNGFQTQVPTRGEWFINPTQEVRRGSCFALAVDGANVRGIPAGDAAGIGALFKRGVRLWFDAMDYATRTL